MKEFILLLSILTMDPSSSAVRPRVNAEMTAIPGFVTEASCENAKKFYESQSFERDIADQISDRRGKIYLRVVGKCQPNG